MSELNVSVCEFKRNTIDSPVEKGFMINEDKLIIDMDGHALKGLVYSYQVLQHQGCLVLKD